MLMRSIAVLVTVGSSSILAQQCDSGVVFDGPIVITAGGTYTGNWESMDPAVPAVMINTSEPVTFVNSRFKGPGNLIYGGGAFMSLTGVALTVQQSCFVGVSPNIAGKARGSPINFWKTASLLVEHCDFQSTGGGILPWGAGLMYDGYHRPNNTITIRYNRFHNIDGRLSDGHGGYQLSLTGADPADAIQFNLAFGVPGIEIAWNQIVNEPNRSRVEDTISLFRSSGTADSPIQVHDNYIQGSYAADAGNATKLNYTGTAINAEGPAPDPGTATGFVKIHHNQVVSISGGGISIASGHDIEISFNRVVSSGQLSDGTNISTPYGGGFFHWNYYMNPASAFGNNSIHDNVSGFRHQVNGQWGRLDYSFAISPAVDFNNLSWSPATSTAPMPVDEANERLLWEEKLIANVITIGSDLVVPALAGGIQVVSGNNQVGSPNATLPVPIVARVLNPAGAPVAGVHVSFMVATANATASQHFAITDSNGLASTGIVLGTSPAAIQVNVIAAGYSGTRFNLWIRQPAPVIAIGGIVGVGNSVPPVRTLSQNQLISIYSIGGQSFLAPGIAGRRVLASEFVDGGLPTALLDVCVDIGGQRAAVLDVFPTVINAQVPAVTGTSVNVRVLANCGTPVEAASSPQTVAVSPASPEFLYFQLNANGVNPIVLVNAVSGVLVGPSNILGGQLTPARAGDILVAYATGFGPLTPALATGQVPSGTAAAVGPISVTIGGIVLAATDILYAGAAPGQIIDQLNFRVPAGIAPGNQPIVISVAGVSSPQNAFVAIQP